MKQKIDRMKHSQLFTKRTLALVLCFVLLIGAIGAGTAITAVTGVHAIASESEAAGNDGEDAGALADSITRNKADLAPVGANADLSDTGVDVNGIVYIRGSFADSWSDTGVAMSQKDGNYFYSVSSLSNGEQFKFKYDGTEYGKSTSENGSGQRNIPTFGSSSSNYNTVEPGSSTFFWTGSKGAVTIWVNSDLTKTWITSGTTQNSFSISYNTPTNGSFSTKPTVGDAGSTVTFVAAPSTGYVIDTVTITDSSTGDPITPSLVSGNTYKFTMPSANVSVNATFKKGTYAITANATGCSVTGFTSPAEYDSTVSFTVTPDTADYALKTLTVKQGTTNITVTDRLPALPQSDRLRFISSQRPLGYINPSFLSTAARSRR